MNLKELSKLTCGDTVTWAELVTLIEQASTVLVCFYAHANGEYVGRAFPVPKDAALAQARDFAARHATDGEIVNVSAAAGSTLYFGSGGPKNRTAAESQQLATAIGMGTLNR